jgi:hypothetical protein
MKRYYPRAAIMFVVAAAFSAIALVRPYLRESLQLTQTGSPTEDIVTATTSTDASTKPSPTTPQPVQETALCLTADQKESYATALVDGEWQATVLVNDVRTGKVLWSQAYREDGASEENGVSVNRCHFYMIRAFNMDAHTMKQHANFSMEVWRYDYFDGTPKQRVISLASNKTGNDADYQGYYGYSFTIDPTEHYIALERGYPGSDNHALAVVDIATSKEVYALAMPDILKTHPDADGSFSSGKWVTRPDGIYLKGNIFVASQLTAFYYIKHDTKSGAWNSTIYETPADYRAGVERSAPPFAPYLAYTDVVVWTGDAEIRDQLIQDQIRAGKQKHLIVANLITGATTTIATTPIIPDHNFRPTWLDDNTLQYTLPDGTKKTYVMSP